MLSDHSVHCLARFISDHRLRDVHPCLRLPCLAFFIDRVCTCTGPVASLISIHSFAQGSIFYRFREPILFSQPSRLVRGLIGSWSTATPVQLAAARALSLLSGICRLPFQLLNSTLQASDGHPLPITTVLDHESHPILSAKANSQDEAITGAVQRLIVVR